MKAPTRYLLALPLLAFAADTWQPFVVDNHLAVQLPGQPAELNLTSLLPAGQRRQVSAHARAWVVRASEGLCVVMRIPNANALRVRRGDSAQRRLFYRDVVRGALAEERQPHLLKRTFFLTSGGNGVELKYTARDASTGRLRVRYMRSLVLDSVGYNLLFRPSDLTDSVGVADYAPRRHFFNSITVKP